MRRLALAAFLLVSCCAPKHPPPTKHPPSTELLAVLPARLTYRQLHDSNAVFDARYEQVATVRHGWEGGGHFPPRPHHTLELNGKVVNIPTTTPTTKVTRIEDLSFTGSKLNYYAEITEWAPDGLPSIRTVTVGNPTKRPTETGDPAATYDEVWPSISTKDHIVYGARRGHELWRIVEPKAGPRAKLPPPSAPRRIPVYDARIVGDWIGEESGLRFRMDGTWTRLRVTGTHYCAENTAGTFDYEGGRLQLSATQTIALRIQGDRASDLQSSRTWTRNKGTYTGPCR